MNATAIARVITSQNEEYMERSAFCKKYRVNFYKLQAAINYGQVALYYMDEKVVINVHEGLSVLRPKSIEPLPEKEKTNLF
jgi:hypothetical protein